MTENNDADTAITALLEFLNAVKTGIANARQILKEAKIGWTPDQIKWEQAEGSSGPYQRSEDVNNPEFKAMLKDLQAHGGRLTAKVGSTGFSKTAKQLAVKNETKQPKPLASRMQPPA